MTRHDAINTPSTRFLLSDLAQRNTQLPAAEPSYHVGIGQFDNAGISSDRMRFRRTLLGITPLLRQKENGIRNNDLVLLYKLFYFIKICRSILYNISRGGGGGATHILDLTGMLVVTFRG